MRPKLQWLWARFCEQVAELSTCERLHVSCVLVPMDGESMYSFGYNGVYKGGPNTCLTPEAGNCGCVHAEANALAKPRPHGPFVAFVSHTPCFTCASLLINAGVAAVYARHRYRDPKGWDLLASVGVSCHVLEG